jgi:hypothetical protein
MAPPVPLLNAFTPVLITMTPDFKVAVSWVVSNKLPLFWPEPDVTKTLPPVTLEALVAPAVKERKPPTPLSPVPTVM